MSILSKKESAPDPVDEVEALKKQIAYLQKAAGIDADALQLKQTQEKHEEEIARLHKEQDEKRQKEQEKKRTDRIKQIDKTFSDELGKKIRVFQILSNETGRWAEFSTNAVCPSCGSADIPRLRELKPKLVESLEAYQRDPVLLFERNPFVSIGSMDMICAGCGHRWTWHYQISL